MFTIEKEKSLIIFHDLFSNLRKNGDVSIHTSMKLKDNILGENVVDLKHSICVVSFEDLNSFIEGYYEKSNKIEIHYGSQVKNKNTIDIVLYNQSERYECDEYRTEFEYNKSLNCWISSDLSMVLDLSEYIIKKIDKFKK